MNSITLVITCTFIWAGFIGAISFMESWVKFKATGLTMPVGLSIGKLVFSALNRAEWFFAIIIGCSLIFSKIEIDNYLMRSFWVIAIILIVQTVWLLPALNSRAKAIINGKTLPPSRLHYYFVGVEFVKLLLLIYFGWELVKTVIIS